MVVLPAFYPKLQTLDILPSYTPEQAYRSIASYGDAGRQLYLVIDLTLDLVYPFITGLLFSLATLYTFQRGFPSHPLNRKLALLPFLPMLADYVENICVIIMLLRYPVERAMVANISGIATSTKFALIPLDRLAGAIVAASPASLSPADS